MIFFFFGKNSLYPDVSGVFQFKPQSFKSDSLPPKVSKTDKLNLSSTFSGKSDGTLPTCVSREMFIPKLPILASPTPTRRRLASPTPTCQRGSHPHEGQARQGQA
jgi:hypothetical protein